MRLPVLKCSPPSDTYLQNLCEAKDFIHLQSEIISLKLRVFIKKL
jgi:hypothetical protein